MSKHINMNRRDILKSLARHWCELFRLTLDDRQSARRWRSALPHLVRL